MGYKDSLPANDIIKKRVKSIQKILKFRGNHPRFSQMDTLEVMTEEYLRILKNKKFIDNQLS